MTTATEFRLAPERFAQGMTFAQYVDYVATPENLAREGSGGSRRPDNSHVIKGWYESLTLEPHQIEALRWLSRQPDAPAKVLVISEDWSSDCRRDVPVFQRMAEAAGWDLRIFNRDGERFGAGPQPEDSPNADLMMPFVNHKNGGTFQSIPVAAFFTADGRYVYHFTEYAAIYDKDRVVMEHIRARRPSETPQQTTERGNREFAALVASPFWRIWAGAAVDEIVSALHRRAVLGVV
jgi:hypothetical protein